MKGYASMGSSVGELLGAFTGNSGAYQKGYNDYLGKAAQQRYYDAKTQEAMLDSRAKQQAMDMTADDLLASFAITPDMANQVRTGNMDYQIPEGEYFDEADKRAVLAEVGDQVSPYNQDMVHRADTVMWANKLSGGDNNVDQIMKALLGAQQMNAQDMVAGGEYDANTIAQAAAAAEGKPIYSDGASGVLNQFLGDVQTTERSRAAANKDNAAAEKDRKGGDAPSKIQEYEYWIEAGLSEEDARDLVYESKSNTRNAFRQKVYLKLIGATDIGGRQIYSEEEAHKLSEQAAGRFFGKESGAPAGVIGHYDENGNFVPGE